MIDISPHRVSERLRRAGQLADLTPARRLYAKLDMSGAGVTRRLRVVSQLLQMCVRLHRIGLASSRSSSSDPVACE